MKIGELSKRSGFTASRIRFYEANGLLHVVERQANGYREYPPDALLILEIISCAQKAGFSLDEIRQLMPPDLGTWRHDQLIQALKKKVADIEALQERLARSRSHLLSLIENIENKPEGLDCADNAKRVLDSMREGVLAAASMEMKDVKSLNRA